MISTRSVGRMSVARLPLCRRWRRPLHRISLVRPLHVTLTGLDAATRLDDLRALSRDFPIEWGILFHPTREGSGRYPLLAQIRSIAECDLKLSAHLCGGYARGIVQGESLPATVVSLLDRFSRIQINTAARGVEPTQIARFAARLAHAASCNAAASSISPTTLMSTGFSTDPVARVSCPSSGRCPDLRPPSLATPAGSARRQSPMRSTQSRASILNPSRSGSIWKARSALTTSSI